MTAPVTYDAQDRGNAAAYDAYYAGMDSTMRQKLAFVGAHFLLDPGSRIADMGCGSGYGTYQLALLNPHVTVIGVDINPESVRIASEKYQLPNLEFIVGDASEPIFADDPLDGILSSSTLHHVYTFNGYSRDAVRRALASHMGCLRNGGVFVLRDFVMPPGNGHVLLELPRDSASDFSDADLLVRFSQTARPLDSRCGPGFFLEEIDPQRSDTRLFRLAHKWAAEFVLRKDYRSGWDVELLEEYTYFTADEFASELATAGGRLVCAKPYWNPWIVKNRFEGRFRLLDETGGELGWPPTNFVAVTERVAKGGSVRLIERRIAQTPPSFLVQETWKSDSESSQEVFDLVRRPEPVCDLLSWRMSEGRLRVVARHGYPRPITCAVPRGPAMIDGGRWGGYLIEPVTGMVPSDASPRQIAALLTERVGIEPDKIGKVEQALTYYPSPGGIDEVVHSYFVEHTSVVQAKALSTTISGLSTAGHIREFDAQDLLRAAHVGVLPEARLEANIYALMDRLGIIPDLFIGEEIECTADPDLTTAAPKALETLLTSPPTAPLVRSDISTGYLRLIRSTFADQTDEEGLPRTLAELDLEFVVPRAQSINTVVALPVACHETGVLVGLESRSLPAPQIHEGNATILTAPAWRLGRDVTTLAGAKEFLASRLHSDRIVPLGAAYFPSAGITPERVHPFVVKIEKGGAALPYSFVRLDDLRNRIFSLRDGHLLVAACRLIHALGLWRKA